MTRIPYSTTKFPAWLDSFFTPQGQMDLKVIMYENHCYDVILMPLQEIIFWRLRCSANCSQKLFDGLIYW